MDAIAGADRKLRLDWVNPHDLGDVWDTVKPGLEAVRKHGDHWRVEDVYLHIKTGTAHLHIGFAENRYAGFILTTQQAHYDGMVLHVWAAYSVARDFDILHDTTDELRKWAVNISAKRITFSSPRKGWARQAEKLGFHLATMTYESEV